MSLIKQAVIGVSAGCLAISAYATTVVPPTPSELYGGGATASAVAYVGTDWVALDANGNESRLSATNLTGSNAVATTSLFGAYTASGTTKKPTPQISYCQSGSTAGRNVFTGATGYSPSTACVDYGTSSNPKGDGTPTGVDINYSAADFGLAAADYTTFNGSGRAAAHGEPVQVPTVAGAIAVIYNPGASGQIGQLILTESQVCKIFSGEISNWNQLGNLASQPITLVVRSDNAGTSYNFSNHLSAVCPNAVGGAVPNVFSTNGYFTLADSALGGTGTATAPNGALVSSTNLTQSSNGGVVSVVLSTPGAIGVAETADAVARASAAGGTGLYYAAIQIQADVAATTKYEGTLTGGAGCETSTGPATKTCKAVKVAAQKFKAWDPIANFPKSVKLPLVSDSVLGANTSNGRPQLETLAAAGITPLKSGCLQVVDPNLTAVPTLSKGDYTQYPIEDVGYVFGFESGNGASAPYIAALLSQQFAISSKVKTIGADTGFAGLALTVDGNAAGTTAAKVVAACIGA